MPPQWRFVPKASHSRGNSPRGEALKVIVAPVEAHALYPIEWHRLRPFLASGSPAGEHLSNSSAPRSNSPTPPQRTPAAPNALPSLQSASHAAHALYPTQTRVRSSLEPARQPAHARLSPGACRGVPSAQAAPQRCMSTPSVAMASETLLTLPTCVACRPGASARVAREPAEPFRRRLHRSHCIPLHHTQTSMRSR